MPRDNEGEDMIYIYWALFTLWGAILYRWRGHASKYKKLLPRPYNQALFALPYVFIAYQVHWSYAVLTLVATTLAVLTGHGGAIDMGKWEKERDDETLEFVVKPLRGKISEFWYDFILMAWLGLAVTIPCGIVTLNPFIALSGALKAPAYAISHRLGFGSDGGEWLTGAFLYASLFFWLF